MDLGGASTAEREVHCISTKTIRPATQSDTTKRLQLTPWDLTLLSLKPIQKGILFNKPGDHEHHTTWLTDLKTSLSRTLDHFFPLAGRLATEIHEEDNTMSIFVHCSNAGAQFLHATADITVSDVLSTVKIPCVVHDLFHLNGSINYDGRSQPLLAIQVTELLDGIFIGCTMNHCVADGASFWHFMNSWSEICRTGCDQISRAPNFNRCFFKETDLPVQIPVSRIQEMEPHTSPPLEEQLFHFTPDNIAKLKARANQEIKNVNPISSLQAVLAHVWIAVTRARNLDPDEEVSYVLAIGNRARLDPPLPEEYFGNSIKSILTSVKAGELTTRGLGFAAELLNQMVKSHTHARISSAWETWVKEPKFFSVNNLVANVILTGSSPRFNMYGNDFGWGCPIGVRSGLASKFDGKMTVFPGAVKGSMVIEACLLPETLRTVAEDQEFMEFVGAVDDESLTYH